MINAEKIFHKIIKQLPNGIEGKMFGAKCIKSSNGKTAAFLWKGNMTFKLDEQVLLEALKLDGAKIGSHLYAPKKQMKGWVLILQKHSDRWIEFARKSIEHV